MSIIKSIEKLEADKGLDVATSNDDTNTGTQTNNTTHDKNRDQAGLSYNTTDQKNKTKAASFLCRAPTEWGNLPDCVIKCRIISSFKTAFNNHFKRR